MRDAASRLVCPRVRVPAHAGWWTLPARFHRSLVPTFLSFCASLAFSDGHALGLRVRLTDIHQLSIHILIVMPHPRHAELQAVLVAALGCKVQEVVRAEKNVQTARVSGVSVENGACLVLVEHA